jgi:hypothetical protein
MLCIPSFQPGVVLIPAEYVEACIVILGQSAFGRLDTGVDLDGRMRHLGGSDPLKCFDFSDHTTGFP